MSGWAEPAFVGARGFDCVTVINEERAMALKAWGMQFAVRYLGSLTAIELSGLLDGGLAVMPVTYGLKHGTPLNAALGANYGATSVRNAMMATIPPGTTTWLDLEDCTGTPEDVIAFVNAWCGPIKTAGYMPGLYVGAGVPLTGAELYALGVTRYWQSLSKEMDRRGAIAEPNCGWAGVDLEEFGDNKLHGLDKNEVEIVVEMEDWQLPSGEPRQSPRIRWINRLGAGNRVNVERAMPASELSAFSQRMRGLAMSTQPKDAGVEFPHGANAPGNGRKPAF